MNPDQTLEPLEARLLGVLIEKELTTPDQYPLSVHAVTTGSNQKSNRDPLMDLAEGEVQQGLAKLIVKGFVGSVQPIGSRVEKYRHNARELLALNAAQSAVLAELLLRGPQQPGELRQRAARMAPIESLAALSQLMQPLIERGLLVRYDSSPGSRAENYGQLLAPHAHPAPLRAPVRPSALATYAATPAPMATAAVDLEPWEKRIDELENEVRKLRRHIDQLAWKLGEKLDA